MTRAMAHAACHHCLRARQLVVHQIYDEECIGCGVRKLAYLPAERRLKFLDTLEFMYGPEARREVAQMAREERARIEALRLAQHARRADSSTA
jgi:hypothetical protein